MASWKKFLARVAADSRPISYSYEQLAGLLVNHLGFELAKPIDGSHRRFRRRIPDPMRPGCEITIVIGLVAPGLQKPVYIKEMLRVLRENSLLPEGVE
jgi:hypothetical protein